MSTWTSKSERIAKYIDRLPVVHQALEADFDSIRSVADATEVANFIQKFYQNLAPLFDEYPTLLSLFDKEFGPFEDLIDSESLNDICFMDLYLYPATESFGFYIDEGVFSKEMLKSHLEIGAQWLEDSKSNHLETQKKIDESFSMNMGLKSLTCQCNGCTADFRTKVREEIVKQQKKIIDDSVEKLFELLLTKKIDYISDFVFNLRKKVDKNYHSVKGKLRKGSINKLQAEVTNYFKSQFDSNSELAKVYKEKIKAYCNSVLVDDDIKPDLVSEDEFERFFGQLHTNIWKPASYIRREFKKVINTIMTLKRKDISSTILRDYLGQFWIHSKARRMKRKIIYHMGPTNSGKTYHAIEALVKARKGCYLAPLRLLASELYDTMNNKGAVTTLLTGEEVIEVEGATHFSSTIEMARLNEEFDCCVIDEIQMITDPQRGWAWTRALVNVISPEIHLCGDLSVLELVKKILKLTGDELEIKEYNRMTELNVMGAPIKLSHLQKNDALIVFSRRKCLKYKNDLEKLGFKVSVVYGRLSPEVRREQARKFDEGETDVMVSTDAIAMGMNLPVKRIVFSTLVKHINSKEIPLELGHIKQIAGRAGRFKRFPVGLVTCLEKVDDGVDTIRHALTAKLDQNEMGMVGPDLDIYSLVNNALLDNGLTGIGLPDFLRLFNTMTFDKPFYCVELKEMIELAEMVEDIDQRDNLSPAEHFGFCCAPVNLGLIDHVEYFMQIVSQFTAGQSILNQEIDTESDNIDYLETGIKCVELYQWLARHFDNKHFVFDEQALLHNKGMAIEKLNELLSERLHKHCSSCGTKMNPDFRFNICERCFSERRFSRRKPGGPRPPGGSKGASGKGGGGGRRKGPGKGPGKGKPSSKRSGKPGSRRKKTSKSKSAPFVKG